MSLSDPEFGLRKYFVLSLRDSYGSAINKRKLRPDHAEQECDGSRRFHFSLASAGNRTGTDRDCEVDPAHWVGTVYSWKDITLPQESGNPLGVALSNLPPQKIRILTIDDHPLLREGIAAIINSQSDMSLVGEAATGKEGIELFQKHRPDITLLDLRLPDQSGIDVLNGIRGVYANAHIIMLTTFDGDIDIQRALAAGARAYVLKSMPPTDLIAVIRQVHSGMKRILPEIAANLAEHLDDEDLTGREVEILQHIVGGNRNRDIAELLFISEETVKAHVKNIMAKLGANDRTEAVAIGIRRGFIQLGG